MSLRLNCWMILAGPTPFTISMISGQYAMINMTRVKRVKISNNKSSWKTMLKGILQGSGFGPFLFNVFMNDIFYFMKICDLLN